MLSYLIAEQYVRNMSGVWTHLIHINNPIQENDVHWAKRRKSSWLAWPGTIKYTRERTVEGEGKEKDDDKVEGQAKKEIEDCGRKGAREIMINVQKRNVRRAQSVDIWPRRTKTDITELYH